MKAKLEMVQSLGDIEIATRVLGDLKQFDEHPADVHYKKLKYGAVLLVVKNPGVVGSAV